MAEKRRTPSAASPRSFRRRWRPSSRDPDASVSEIAKVAERRPGHRATGASPNRADLVDAALGHAIEQGDFGLDDVDLTGDPGAALTRLIGSSWQLVDRSRSLLMAAQSVLPPSRIRRAARRAAAERVRKLVERGRDEGVFRTDLPTEWLVGVMHSVMHHAADEINAGRLRPQTRPRTTSRPPYSQHSARFPAEANPRGHETQPSSIRRPAEDWL